jgi:subtilase family serine protease
MPTDIIYDDSSLSVGNQIIFDSGIRNNGNTGTGSFNIKWYVNDVQVGYGGHEGIPANSTVLDGNSQYWWTPASPGTYIIKFVVDNDNAVLEFDESNNEKSVTVTVPETETTTLYGNLEDLVILSLAYGSTSADTDGRWDVRADLNGDGKIDKMDFEILKQNYLR